MDLFKSVFSDNPDPSNPQNTPTSPPKSQSEYQEVYRYQPDPKPPSSNPNPAPKPSVAAIASAWSFGGLIKTLASKSESVIETYRRDLEEFGAGLRKETSAMKEVAGRAVKDLPTSLEAGAVAAQESLESVGHAIDNIGNTVSEIIISHGNYSELEADSGSETSDSMQIGNDQQNSRSYSRIDAQIRAVQCDLNTYCEEPEDLDEYCEWKLGFKVDEKGEEIENLIQENGLIEGIYNEVVPNKVDQETFWKRFFYKVYKVKKTEEARAKLVKRAISGEEEEEDLRWDVDDDDYEESDDRSKLKNVDSEGLIQRKDSSEKFIDNSKINENDDAELASESKIGEKVHLDESEWSGNALGAKSDEKLGLEEKAESGGGSSKDSDFSVVSSQPSMAEEEEEEDLGWDEIEDIGSGDETKVTTSGSPNRVDLRKRLSAMEEEEDLGWDIEEDDDEPVKSSS